MKHRGHHQFCSCDLCEGAKYLDKHRPREALFDGDFEPRGRGPYQRSRKWDNR